MELEKAKSGLEPVAEETEAAATSTTPPRASIEAQFSGGAIEMTADDAPKGVVTLAFTDIQGSTRLWEHVGEVVGLGS